jgi:hypothetical protein
MQMKPSEYLDALRQSLKLPSDYALQKPLGLSKSAISNYRRDKDFFSDEVAIRVAEALEMDAGLVVLDMHRERAKTPTEQRLWASIFEGFPSPLLRANRVVRVSLPR